jgi:hypothetical protein
MGRKAYKVLIVKPEGKRSLGRHSRRWDVKMDSKEIGWERVDSIHVAQEWAKWLAAANKGMNILVPQKGGKCLKQPRNYLILKDYAPWS